MQLLLRKIRNDLGISQIRLAHLSGISLPTIQNIEAGKGNPSWETIQSLAQSMGLEIKIEPKRANWDELARCGAPLTSSESKKGEITPELLCKNLKEALLELAYFTDIPDRERKLEATQALLLAIQRHYPSFFKESLESSPLMVQFFPKSLTGRLIKLQRIALSRLSEIL